MRQSALAASISRFEALAFLVGFLLSVGAHADERPEARVFEPVRRLSARAQAARNRRAPPGKRHSAPPSHRRRTLGN